VKSNQFLDPISRNSGIELGLRLSHSTVCIVVHNIKNIKSMKIRISLHAGILEGNLGPPNINRLIWNFEELFKNNKNTNNSMSRHDFRRIKFSYTTLLSYDIK
jgi:hypothetical protein